jgi:hypothetical protein
MPAHLPLYLEDIERVYILHALDLPGCYSEGADETVALSRFAAALSAYLDWCARHAERVPLLPDDYAITERFASYTLPSGYEVNALFRPERAPADRELLALYRRLLGHAGADILAAARSVPADRWHAPATVGDRTPARVLEHVARAERWYLSHFTDPPSWTTGVEPPSLVASFEAVHDALLVWLASAPADQLGAIAVDREEEWSVRKLLRRALWHLRTHTAELARFGAADLEAR